MTSFTPDADDRLLAEWLRNGPESGPAELLEQTFSTIRQTRQQPAWTMVGWWVGDASSSDRARRLAAVALFALLAAAVGLAFGAAMRQRPNLDAPTDRLTVWLVVGNERPADVAWAVRGGILTDAGPGADSDHAGVVVGCSTLVLAFQMGGSWTISVDGRPVSGSAGLIAAGVGLGNESEVTLRVRAWADGLEVSDLVAGRPRDAGGPPPGCPEPVASPPGIRPASYPGEVLRPGVRYVVPDFGPPIAFTVPSDLPGEPVELPGRSSRRSTYYLNYSLPGFGWEITATPNRHIGTCTGVGVWLTGEDREAEPARIESVEAFLTALTTWDTADPSVALGVPRALTIGGRPAVAIDVIAAGDCPLWPGLEAGDVLERDFAIDVGGEVRIVAIGVSAFEAGLNEDRLHLTFRSDPALLEIGERWTTSLELLP